jgi:uncharacterized protein YdaU (DUF1376 family)
MAKVPYIPLYIGDWEQDTNCISPLAEFALLKLTFKLFKSEKRGVIVTNFNTLSILFKSNMATTKEIFNELYDNNILNFEFIEDDKIRIISRRMVREGNLSEIRSNCGKEGGRGNKANEKQKESKKKAKVKQIPDCIFHGIKWRRRQASKFSFKAIWVNTRQPLHIHCGVLGKPLGLSNVDLTAEATNLRCERGDYHQSTGILGLRIG